MYIDTHAHITSAFYDDLSSVISDIKEANITKVVNIATCIAETEDVLTLAKKHSNFLYPAIGIHPENAANKDLASQIKEFEKLVVQNKDIIIAIGECGLDYKDLEDETIKDKQKELFKFHIGLCERYNLPIIIHCREALDDLISILTSYNKSFRGVLHSADGTTTQIQKILDLGLYTSFNGIVTFKNASQINNLASFIPIDRILLETDSPFLAPTPVRGTKNTPANIKYIYKYVAEKKNIDLEEFNHIINKNADELFSLST